MTPRTFTLATLAALATGLAIALVKARSDAREGYAAAQWWQQECASWMDDSNQQALIIARISEGSFGDIFEQESVH